MTVLLLDRTYDMAQLANTSLINDPNLRAYYKLENVNDTTANAYNLTNTGSIAFNAAKYGLGADMEASNSSKYLSRSSENPTLGIDGGDQCSFSMWVKLRTEIPSGGYTFFRFNVDNVADRFWELEYQHNSGTPRLALNVAGNTAGYNITLGTSAWYHIVCLVRPNGGTCELWVNGVQRATTTSSTSSGGAVNNFAIGGRVGGSNFASAIFDDTAVFDDILTEAEILTLYKDTGGSFLLNLI